MSEADLAREAYSVAKATIEDDLVRVEKESTVSTMRIREAADKVDVNVFIPNKVRQDLLKGIGTPLGGNDELPKPKDLRAWWQVVERAILAINVGMDLGAVSQSGCHLLGPLLLGQAAYNSIQSEYFPNWETFKRVVNERFGMSES